MLGFLGTARPSVATESSQLLSVCGSILKSQREFLAFWLRLKVTFLTTLKMQSLARYFMKHDMAKWPTSKKFPSVSIMEVLIRLPCSSCWLGLTTIEQPTLNLFAPFGPTFSKP